MKKLLGLVIVSLLAFTALSAQDAAPSLKISGTLYTGFEMDAVADQDPTIYLYNQEGGTASLFDLNANFSAADWGVSARLRTLFTALDTDVASWPIVTLPFAYGWFDAFDDVVRVSIGRVASGAWQTNGDEYYGAIRGKEGIQVQIKPVKGLNFGFLMPIKVTELDLVDSLSSIQLGLGWDIESALNVRAGFTFDSSDLADSDAYLGLEQKAVENLTALVEASYANVADSASSELDMRWDIAYTLDAFTFGSVFTQAIPLSDSADLGFNPYVSWQVLETLAFGANVSYDFNTAIADEGIFGLGVDATWSLTDSNYVQLGTSWSNADTSTFTVFMDLVATF